MGKFIFFPHSFSIFSSELQVLFLLNFEIKSLTKRNDTCIIIKINFINCTMKGIKDEFKPESRNRA